MKTSRLIRCAIVLGCLTLSGGVTLFAEDKAVAKPEPKSVKNPETTEASPKGEAAPARVKKPIPPDEELQKILTPIQYHVTQNNGTERPFGEAYEQWKKEGDGIYVDLITGEALFSSKDKFDAHCGWPAFSKPIKKEEVKEVADTTHGMTRVEVRSESGDAHLGHVFTDGPKELGGLRYCINAAAIRFVPKEEMKAAGYGDFLKLFEEKPTAAK